MSCYYTVTSGKGYFIFTLIEKYFVKCHKIKGPQSPQLSKSVWDVGNYAITKVDFLRRALIPCVHLPAEICPPILRSSDELCQLLDFLCCRIFLCIQRCGVQDVFPTSPGEHPVPRGTGARTAQPHCIARNFPVRKSPCPKPLRRWRCYLGPAWSESCWQVSFCRVQATSLSTAQFFHGKVLLPLVYCGVSSILYI